jgi:hypothetical protein
MTRTPLNNARAERRVEDLVLVPVKQSRVFCNFYARHTLSYTTTQTSRTHRTSHIISYRIPLASIIDLSISLARSYIVHTSISPTTLFSNITESRTYNTVIMSRGNQRDTDRAKAQVKAQAKLKQAGVRKVTGYYCGSESFTATVLHLLTFALLACFFTVLLLYPPPKYS